MSKVDPRPKLELSLLPPFYEDFHKNENMPFFNLNVGSWVKRVRAFGSKRQLM
jgi:hypothetical protein